MLYGDRFQKLIWMLDYVLNQMTWKFLFYGLWFILSMVHVTWRRVHVTCGMVLVTWSMLHLTLIVFERLLAGGQKETIVCDSAGPVQPDRSLHAAHVPGFSGDEVAWL